MITYNWTINQMDRLTADGFVVTVHYNVSAVDGNYQANTYGTVGFTDQPEGQFVPYDQLTQSQVIGWVKNALGQETVESSLASQIDALKNPVVESGLPWSN